MSNYEFFRSGFVDTTGALLHSLIHTYVGEAMNSNDFNAQIPGILDVCRYIIIQNIYDYV